MLTFSAVKKKHFCHFLAFTNYEISELPEKNMRVGSAKKVIFGMNYIYSIIIRLLLLSTE